MSDDTFPSVFSVDRLSADIKALMAARALAQMTAPGAAEAVLYGPQRNLVEWLTQDVDRNTDIALVVYGQLATSSNTSLRASGWTTTYEVFAPLDSGEIAHWDEISREIRELQQRDSLIPNDEIRGLARRLAVRDYGRENIQEWARKLSQLPFTDEE